MKIVMLCEFFNENLEYQENLLAKYYRKHNHQVTIITSTLDSVFDYYGDKHDIDAPTRIYEVNGVKIIKLQYKFIRLKNRLRKYKDITSILEEENPDLIYVHDIMLNMLEAVAYKKLNPHCKMIMDYHADYSNSANGWLSLNILHKIIRKKFYWDRAKKHISKVFPIVPAGFIFLNEVYNVPYSDMELLPLGADTDLGNEIRQSKEGANIREKLGISPSDFVIFTGGKLTSAKKTEILISAFLEINSPNTHLIIVGAASEADKLYMDSLLALSNKNPRIHFVGWQKNQEVYKYLDAADIAVFPASQSILWQQAISMHLPLVVGDMGSQSIEYLNKYENIIILTKEFISIDTFVKHINTLLHDTTTLEKMEIGAAKITDEMLNWDKLIYKTLQYN
jgi:1,2-diacylglycerol 3-alpha-glucosyltransferase